MECYGKLMLTKMQMRTKFLGKDIFSEQFFRQTLSDYHKKLKSLVNANQITRKKIKSSKQRPI